MLEFGACPLCKQNISPERKKLSPVVCNHCGFTVSNNQTVQKEMDKKNIQIMLGISAIVVACYVQIMNWDSAWLSIIPLSFKETVGMSSQSDLDAKASICMEQKKWDCVEQQYLKAAQRDPLLFERAAHFEMKRAKYSEAAQNYYKFFQAGGEQNLDAQYNYAKALAQLGQVDEATKYFDQVLASRPDVLQITVVHNYVKMLMEHQRYDQARDLINKIRRDAGPEAGSFMEAEFKKIQEITTASRD